MEYVIMEGVTVDFSRAMAEKCYEASRLMALNTDFPALLGFLEGLWERLAIQHFASRQIL